MNIDWSKAPEGATHYGREDDCYVEAFYKLDGCCELFARIEDSPAWQSSIDRMSSTRRLQLIARPVAAAGCQSWTGEGLPPVGANIEIAPPIYNAGTRAEVVGHHEGKAVICYLEGDKLGSYSALEPGEFRPLRTPEQIAAEEREKAIEEMILVDGKGSLSRTHFCGLLYDANYRKQVTP